MYGKKQNAIGNNLFLLSYALETDNVTADIIDMKSMKIDRKKRKSKCGEAVNVITKSTTAQATDVTITARLYLLSRM